jgi:CBS domain-containing protein
LKYKSIGQMLQDHEGATIFKHAFFQSIDAEDSAYQMCRLLQRQNTDFVPVTDPVEGNLVAVLGYLDIVNLLDTASRQFPHLFDSTIGETQVGTYNVVTCPESMRLADALAICEQRSISSIPVVDAAGVVTGLYYKSDVSFITKNPNPDVILTNIGEITVADVVAAAPLLPLVPQISTSSSLGPISLPPHVGPDGRTGQIPQTFKTCHHADHIRGVLGGMMDARVTRTVVVDAEGKCLGIVSIKDIILHYWNSA